ncbi:TetR/AcrR family transcriptional regulator [Kitasatospora sp. RB6PN24]|uniref:TetR/AcrR family transcriptional regulator n=1 Tax=Kitasatospora humi TaxID=2893891 RepID=UPI001E4AADBB|nr:TetR/AcrR family transcriptional regulator [Kitasatospora humi]MCC9308379.1 TetR/AcrR family transcriptional regulator [Kitasatospora humi]
MVLQQRKVDEPMTAANAIPEERILDAAYELLLAIGMKRLTMADIARRAEVSRATLYRRWPNVRAVIAALVTREFAAVVDRARLPEGPSRTRVTSTVVHLVGELRTHPLLRKIIEVDPDFLVPYVFERRGTSTEMQLALVRAGIEQGQDDGSIRGGDAAMLARSVLLSAWSFTLTGPVLVAPSEYAALDAELSELIDRYLAP